jgi:FMN phosphatase YigB (HAD superfamily)
MWIVFDVDGVLIDVRESYDTATKLTAEYFLRLFGIEREIKPEWARELRRKGSFGDDFKVSEALILFALAGNVDGLIEEFPGGQRGIPGGLLGHPFTGISSLRLPGWPFL